MKLKLSRPLVFFDLETTGTNITDDRIVEISVLKVMPDGTRKTATTRVNPQCHIPEGASAVHHITDDDVANERTFAEIAPGLAKYLSGCDIAGFNSNRFDVPLLIAEFRRAGIPFMTDGIRFIDVQTIYHKREPRNLTAAYKYYCGKDLEGAHAAEADIAATYEVLLGQLEMYDDLPTDVDGLSRYTTYSPEGTTPIDATGKLYKNEHNQICFNFSKYKGHPVKEVFAENPGMAEWCCDPQRAFPSDVASILNDLRKEVAISKTKEKK